MIEGGGDLNSGAVTTMDDHGVHVHDEFVPVGFLATTDLGTTVSETELLLEHTTAINIDEDGLVIP